MVSTSKNEL